MRARGLFPTLLILAACSTTTHPLDKDGSVAISSDTLGPLFAAPSQSTQARQRFSEIVTLSLVEDGDPGRNAFVDISVLPPAAVTLHSTDGSCDDHDGVFRCTGNEQGLASFRVSADGSWSSNAPATISALWSDKHQDLPVTVLPSGLPAGTTAFALDVGSVGSDLHVAATYRSLACGTTSSVPASPWPSAPRSVPVSVRVTPPPGDPDAIIGAPVTIESGTPDAELAMDATCTNRSSRVLVPLGDSGVSPIVWACFDDIGGSLPISAFSGQVVGLESGRKTVVVDAEPVSISVLPINPSVKVAVQAPLVEVAAFGFLQQRIPLRIRAFAPGTSAVQLSQATFGTRAGTDDQLAIIGTPTAPGTFHVTVSPETSSNIRCDSSDIASTP